MISRVLSRIMNNKKLLKANLTVVLNYTRDNLPQYLGSVALLKAFKTSIKVQIAKSMGLFIWGIKLTNNQVFEMFARDATFDKMTKIRMNEFINQAHSELMYY